MVRITARRNDKLGIDIPQMTFHGRVDDLIDIAGFTRLTEKVIWQAIENTTIPYEEWTVRKELRDKPVLHLYIELRGQEDLTAEDVALAVHNELVKLDAPYADLEAFLGLRPFEVTILPPGAFTSYKLTQQAAGADLAHLKPPHINPSNPVIECLTQTAAAVPVTAKVSNEETISTQ
jgi:hypothetical protein